MNEHADAQSVCLKRGAGRGVGREEEWDGMRRVTGGGVGREEWFWSISAFEIVRKFLNEFLMKAIS